MEKKLTNNEEEIGGSKFTERLSLAEIFSDIVRSRTRAAVGGVMVGLPMGLALDGVMLARPELMAAGAMLLAGECLVAAVKSGQEIPG